jgi:hypothetical protein
MVPIIALGLSVLILAPTADAYMRITAGCDGGACGVWYKEVRRGCDPFVSTVEYCDPGGLGVGVGIPITLPGPVE